MTALNLVLLVSPWVCSLWGVYARPVPAVLCLAAAGLFLSQSVRYLRKARAERDRANASLRKLRWLRASMVASFILAAAWFALLSLELRYPDSSDPSSPPHAEIPR